MNDRKRDKGGLRLKPSYSTRVHIKRRLYSTDWLFILALIGLAALIAVIVLFFS